MARCGPQDYESGPLRSRRTISMPVSAASRPLLVSSGRERTRAWSSVSVVSTPKIDGHPGGQLHLLDPGGALPGHEVVVAGVAADDGAEAEHGVDLAGVGEGAGHQGQLERARRPGHGDVPAVRARLVQRLAGRRRATAV